MKHTDLARRTAACVALAASMAPLAACSAPDAAAPSEPTPKQDGSASDGGTAGVSQASYEPAPGIGSFVAPPMAWAADAQMQSVSGSASGKAAAAAAIKSFSAASDTIGSIADSAWTATNALIVGDGPSNSDIYQKVVELSGQLNDISAQIKQLNDEMAGNYYATIVNDANAVLASVQSDYSLVQGLYQSFLDNKSGPAARDAALDKLMANKRPIIDSLFKDLSQLHGKLVCADAKTSSGPVAVFDNMAQRTYNWAVNATLPRAQYRTALMNVWTTCTAMLYATCGSEAYREEYGPMLDNLQAMTTKMTGIFAASPVVETEGMTTATVKSDDGSQKDVSRTAYRCYTTNQWHSVLSGDAVGNGWGNAFSKTTKRGKLRYYSEENPFSRYGTETARPSWGSLYMDSAEASALAAREPSSGVQADLGGFEANVPRYFVTSARFDMSAKNMPHNANDWYFDTYYLGSDGTWTHDSNMRHFNGDVKSRPFAKDERMIVSKTDLKDMFILSKEKPTA